MADAAIFVGWGEPVRGREEEALRVFEESMAYYAGLHERGEIESFEPVLLEPHGGGLTGFVLLRGTAEQLFALHQKEEFGRLQARKRLIVEDLGYVNAWLGDNVPLALAQYREELAGIHVHA